MDKARVEPTIFFIEKISFSLKLFSGHFYGQFCPRSLEMYIWLNNHPIQCENLAACAPNVSNIVVTVVI